MVGKMLDYFAANPPPVLKAVIALLRIVVQERVSPTRQKDTRENFSGF